MSKPSNEQSLPDLTKISKYLSFLLRHRSDTIGLALNENGWASIDELIQKSTDVELNRDILELVVETNDKQRFAISDDGKRIRSNQGHSISIDLNLEATEPPSFLIHGTARRFMPSIQKEGLVKGKRHHVHLTESMAVAKSVGGRYGEPVLLRINSKAMMLAGFEFFKTVNNVWLVDTVPMMYMQEM